MIAYIRVRLMIIIVIKYRELDTDFYILRLRSKLLKYLF